MPSKKKKYNARFPAGRIKKIMQKDEEVGKVAQAVPVIISRTLELFVESLLSKALNVTNKRNAKTLSPSHVKQCILEEPRFDFLRHLVKNIPDISYFEEREAAPNLTIDDSPKADRYVEVEITAPGPSHILHRPHQTVKKVDSQSSDSGSDHEPPFKRISKPTFGNGKNIPKPPNFDEALKSFISRTDQTHLKSMTCSNDPTTSGYKSPPKTPNFDETLKNFKSRVDQTLLKNVVCSNDSNTSSYKSSPKPPNFDEALKTFKSRIDQTLLRNVACSNDPNISSYRSSPKPPNFDEALKSFISRTDQTQLKSITSSNDPNTSCYKSLQKPSNFDEGLKTFKSRIDQTQLKNVASSNDPNTSSYKNSASMVPLSGENNNNKQKLFNFYAETLPDTSDDDKEKIEIKPMYNSVIQPNPDYSPVKETRNLFGFYKSVNSNQETKQEPSSEPHLIPQSSNLSNSNSSSVNISKFHIDLTKGFQPQTNIAMTDTTSSVTPYQVNVPPVVTTPTLTSLLVNETNKKCLPALQVIKRSFSLPEPSTSSSQPSHKIDKPLRKNSTSGNDTKHIEHSSHSFDLSSTTGHNRKNEPPLLLPINLIHRSRIGKLKKDPVMELDEDYDT